MTTKTYYAPSLFINHGGGPNPVLGENYNLEIAETLRNIPKYVDFERVRAVIVATAHREEDVVTVSSGETHELVYDYSNFPAESYTYKHAARGAPEIARDVHAALTRAGIDAALDDVRGWDHGVFIPMMLADPAARVPIIQVSILKSQDAARHFEIGRALRPFRELGVAIIGSGMSYHNMKELNRARFENDGVIVNESFYRYLNEVCTGGEDERKRILDWEREIGALEAHPRGKADHFMPLIINVGAAGADPCEVVFDSVFMKKFKLGGYLWSQ